MITLWMDHLVEPCTLSHPVRWSFEMTHMSHLPIMREGLCCFNIASGQYSNLIDVMIFVIIM